MANGNAGNTGCTANAGTADNTGNIQHAAAAYQMLEQLHALNEDFIEGQMLEYDEEPFEQYFAAREQIFRELESCTAQEAGGVDWKADKRIERMFRVLSEQESLIMNQLQTLRLQANQKLDQFQAAQRQRMLYDDHPYQRNSDSNSVFFDRRK